MGLVNELQESAERDDVLTVLRKARRVSAKLNLREISQWLDHEQNGYPTGNVVPSYRRIGVTFCYKTNGYIPAGYGMLKSGIEPLRGFDVGATVPILDPISTIVAWAKKLDDGGALYQDVPSELSQRMRNMMHCDWPEILQQISFVARLNDAQIRDVAEQVKNKVLDWACDLETAGVTGDGHSFSSEEKKVAQNVVFNITHSTIDQLNSSGDNIQES